MYVLTENGWIINLKSFKMVATAKPESLKDNTTQAHTL